MKIFRASICLWFALAAPAFAQNVGFNPSADGISFPQKAYADLPPATASAGLSYMVPDTPNGMSLVVSDGTNWRVFARGLSAQKYVLLSGDAGSHTFSFAFTASPTIQVTLEDNTTAGMLSYFVTNKSNTGVTVTVQRGQLLPLLATLLPGFNPFTGGSTTGITIDILAVPSN